MPFSLKDKTVQALIWSFFERFGIRMLTLFFSIFLARLLSPEDYGIVAMPVVFISIATCLIDSGFSSALIRKESLNDEDLNTAFVFNIIVGCVCYFTLWILSPWISQFFHVTILEPLLKVSAITTLIGASCAVQGTLLTRDVEFKTIAKISMFSSLSSGVIAIVLALKGWGVWTLVWQGLIRELVRAIILWIIIPWRPRIACSTKSLKYLWNFGSKLMLSSILNIMSENIYPILIGKFYNTALLGNFMKGFSLASMPSLQATETLQRVTYPVLCKLQGDNVMLSVNYRKVLRLSAFVVFPIMIGLLSAAKPIVLVLLGYQWNGVVTILQLLSLGMMLYPIHAINLNLLQVKGRSDLFLQLEIIKTIMGVIALIIVVPRGILWMAGCVPILSFLSLFVNTLYTGKLINVGLLKQLGDLFPTFLVSSCMGICIFYFNFLISNIYLQLIIDILFGCVIYILLSRLFLKEEWHEAMNVIKIIKNKIK